MKTNRAPGSAPLLVAKSASAEPMGGSARAALAPDMAVAVDSMLLGHSQPEPANDEASEGVRRKLVKLGLLTSLKSKTLEVDTQKALLAFQREQGLAPTGAADAPTIAKMDQLIQAKVETFEMKPKDPFLQALLPDALEIERTQGIPAAVILAQAALESSYGKKAIGTYNIFGIKGKGSDGTVEVTTHEYVKGIRKKVKEPFAKFATYAEALKRHAEVFYNGHYNKAMPHLNAPKAFAKAIQGIYATDPRYAQKLVAIMRSQNLIPPEPKPAPKPVVKKPISKK
jgi:flagellum-specific peptidoglycan hydrolase FlgJ